jgi:hypothetical protein
MLVAARQQLLVVAAARQLLAATARLLMAAVARQLMVVADLPGAALCWSHHFISLRPRALFSARLFTWVKHRPEGGGHKKKATGVCVGGLFG